MANLEPSPRAQTRRRAIAASAAVAALIALVALYLRDAHDAALGPHLSPGARERALDPKAAEPEPEPAERSLAGTTASHATDALASPVLRGIVLDAADTPIPGATVEATAEGLEKLARPSATERTTGATLSDGTFELHVEDGVATYRVRVQADGYFPELVDSIVPSAAPITVRLRAAPSLQGTVRTTTGAAVVGARVRLLARTDFGDLLELETESDTTGRYRLSGSLLDLQHLESPLLEASATTYAPTRVPLRDFAFSVTRAPTLEVLERDLVLSPGNRFTGHVRDATGSPVTDAELTVFTHAGRDLFTDAYGTLRTSGLGPTPIGSTRSGANGEFVLAGLPVRTGDGAEQGFIQSEGDPMGSVRVRADGYALGGAPLPWTNEGDPTAPLDIVLLRSATFSGRVVDAHGAPLHEAKIGIHLTGVSLRTIVPNGMLPDGYGDLLYWSPAQPEQASYLWVRTDADGRFESPALPCTQAGEAHVRFKIDWRTERADWRAIQLRAGEQRELGDLVLSLRMTKVAIEGAVLDPDGAPITGAEVHLQDAGMHRTDRAGRFRFERRAPPEEAFPSLDLEVRARGFVTHREVLNAAPTGPLEVQLVRGNVVRGTLSFEDGAPVARGRVSFDRPRQPGRGWVWSDSIGWTTTDDLGRFAFTELPAPPWDVTFGVDRSGAVLEGRMTLHEPRSDLALVLPGVFPAFAALELGVADSGGQPIEAVRFVGLRKGQQSVAGLRRDARTFVFPEMAPGVYELELTAPGFAAHTESLELAPGERARLDVTLETGARVSVRVTPPPASLTHLSVLAVSTEHETRRGAVEQDGRAELGVLAHGPWTVGLVAQALTSGTPRWFGATKSLEVPIGTPSLDFNLERPELGRVQLELPVHGAADPSIPPRIDPADTTGSLAYSDRLQAWSSARNRYVQRANELTLELQDDTGVVLAHIALEDVELDAKRNRVLGLFTAPTGDYTLVMRRGTELLRRSAVRVLPDVLLDLDP
jgi:hypothetical protein